jgi:hypothetical protein
LKLPSDFKVNELNTLLKHFGFIITNKGKTSGSRMAYINEKTGDIIRIHKPHPGKIIKAYVLKDIVNFLKDKEYIY